MDKVLKGLKITILNSIIFCNLQNSFGLCDNLSGKNDKNNGTNGDGSSDDKKKEEAPETPEEKEKKELEQFRNSVSQDFRKTIKFEKDNLVNLVEDNKNSQTNSIFDKNSDLKVNPNALKNEDQWFTYNSIFDFTNNLKEFLNIVNKYKLEPNNENNEKKLSEMYVSLIVKTIDELKKHLNYNINTVKNNIELVNQLNIKINNGFKFGDFFQKYLNGVITGKKGLSNYHLINDAESVELYLDDILTSYYQYAFCKREDALEEFQRDKNILFTDEAKEKINEYINKPKKFRLKNEVDIIYDSNEYVFCNFGSNAKNAGVIKNKTNEKQLMDDASIAEIEYLNKVVKNVIGVENAIDINKIKKTDDIIEQLNKYFDKDVIPGTYRVLLKSRVYDNKNFGFIVLRDKTSSPS